MKKILAPNTRNVHWLANVQFGVPIAIGIALAFTLSVSRRTANVPVSSIAIGTQNALRFGH